MTSIGAMRHTIPGIAAELGWTEKAFREALREAFAKGMVKVDESASLITLPKFIKHNPPESPNVVKSWNALLSTLPECVLLFKYLQEVKAFVEGLGKGFAEALPEPLAKGMPNPELDPEQEQEPEQDKKTRTLVSVDLFDRWYAEYPRKQGIGAARKAWAKYSFDAESVDDMLAVLSWQKRVWARSDPKFIPMPATYLNQERWRDEKGKQLGDTYNTENPDEPMPF